MSVKTIIVFFTILPLIAAFFDSKFYNYAPFLILFFLFLVNISSYKKLFIPPLSLFFILLVTFVHLLIQIAAGVGYGSGGIILLLVEAFLIYQLINFYEQKFDFDYIVTFFLSFSILILYFEFFFRILGYEFILVDLFGNAENVSKFKTYNTAHWFIQSLGIKGLNSMFLGSQIAGLISLISLTFFLGKKFYLEQNKLKINILLILSLIMYLITMTQTTNLLLAINLTFIFFFIPKYIGFKSLSFRIVLLLIIFLSFLYYFEFILRDIIFFKLNEDKDIDLYLNLFFDPYNEYLKLDFKSTIFGIGRSKWDYQATADLGYFGILFRVGLPYFIFISLFIVYCLFKSLIQFSKIKSINYFSFFFLINTFFIFFYWGSLIHYTSAVELGCREIFAFQIGCFYTMINKMKYVNDK